MTRYAVLLRGVNVGGNARVPMAELRAGLDAAGFADVATLLQSGNVVLSSSSRPAAVASTVEGVIAEAFGLTITAVVRTATALRAALDRIPYDDAEDTYLAFLAAVPDPGRVAAFDTTPYQPDEVVVDADVAYLRYPSGAGRTKLTNDLIERRLGVRATTRNWRTTTKVLAAVVGTTP